MKKFLIMILTNCGDTIKIHFKLMNFFLIEYYVLLMIL